MLPNRPTLRGWNPESLNAAAAAITAKSTSVADSVKGMDDECQRMPETRVWAGRSHEAAEAMFGRAARQASTLSDYANALASALRNGSGVIGSARAGLLSKADEADAGPLSVTDEWVVIVDPVRMTQEQLAKLKALARSEQEAINRLLSAVGDADDETANAMVAAGGTYGFEETGEPTDLGSMIVPTAQRPADQVPNPRDPLGMLTQEGIRGAHESMAIVAVSDPVKNEYGDEVTTVTMQDGSRSELTVYDPFDWPSRQGFASITQFDKNGNETSRASSWHDLQNGCDYTSISWPNGANWTMTQDPSGYRSAGFTTPDGRHSAVPVELIDQMSLVGGSGLSGLEKHLGRGGGLPMVTAESLESVSKATKFGGPALTVATTVFDMAMADSRHDACVALVAGAAGFGGGWGGAEGGAALGTLTGPFAPVGVPVLAVVGALGGGYLTGELGKVVGDIVCPY